MAGEWKSMTLSEACVFLSRGVTPSYTEDGGIRVLNQKCVRDQTVTFAPARRTDTNKKNVPKEKLLQPNDILVNSTGEGTLGRVAQIKTVAEPTTVDSHVTILRPNPKLVDPPFLGCLVRKLQPEIEQMAEGSTGQTELSRTRLGELEIDIPPLAEQKAIAAVLGALDDKIELNRRMNATLEAMARALFQSWFVDFDPVSAKQEGRKPTGMDDATAALFPDSFRESDLGEIPAGWTIRSLNSLSCYISRGIGPSYLECGGGVCVLNQRCVRDHRVDVSNSRRHDAIKKPIKDRALELHDILVNSTGMGTLGRVAQVLHLPETAIVDSHITVVRAGPDTDRFFLGIDLIGRESEIEELGEGSTGQTELSRKRLGELKIVAPPFDLQKVFGAAAEPLLMRISKNDNQSRTLATLRDTLLPKLLSGELRVPDAEQAIAAE
jgi:type I restriction enzyme S subunit